MNPPPTMPLLPAVKPTDPPSDPSEESLAVAPPARRPDAEDLAIVLVVSQRMVWRTLTVVAACLLSLFVVRTYVNGYDPQFGWTKLIIFGEEFREQSLPRLQRTTHYTETSEGGHSGYDGQFYAQIALDPSLQDPGFKQALDMPAYRSRRIGLPAFSYLLGWGKPRRILQAYALANLLFWFVLLAALWRLLRPGSLRTVLCLGAGTLCLGVITSMTRALVDLPAAALLFAGLAAGAWGGRALLVAAVLTRETNLLAAGGFWDGQPPWRGGAWKRLLVLVAATVVPLALWMLYVNHRFGHDSTTGFGNFSWPLQAMYERFTQGVQRCAQIGFQKIFHKWWRGGWLYEEYEMVEVLVVAATFFQGLFLILRREWQSPFWRMGVCYLALGAVLGMAVWDDSSAAARVLLPMSICFYLQLARERKGWWFWPFFLLGSLSTPFAVHDFWNWN